VACVLMYTIVNRLNSRMGLRLNEKLEAVKPAGSRRGRRGAG